MAESRALTDLQHRKDALYLSPSDEASRAELRWITWALGALEGFAAYAEDHDAAGVLLQLMKLELFPIRFCACMLDSAGMPNEPTAHGWIERCHVQYNRAIWELISSKPGLVEGLRPVLQAAIEGEGERSGRHLYGDVFDRAFGRGLLRGLITQQPSHEWIGNDHLS